MVIYLSFPWYICNRTNSGTDKYDKSKLMTSSLRSILEERQHQSTSELMMTTGVCQISRNWFEWFETSDPDHNKASLTIIMVWAFRILKFKDLDEITSYDHTSIFLTTTIITGSYLIVDQNWDTCGEEDKKAAK